MGDKPNVPESCITRMKMLFFQDEIHSDDKDELIGEMYRGQGLKGESITKASTNCWHD